MTTVDLSPNVDSWNPDISPTISGNGTALGDTITITNGDKSKTVTTTVDENGNWTADLTGFDPSTDTFVVESNDLGDTPGIVAVPQVVDAQREIGYVDESGKEIQAGPTQPKPNVTNYSRGDGDGCEKS